MPRRWRLFINFLLGTVVIGCIIQFTRLHFLLQRPVHELPIREQKHHEKQSILNKSIHIPYHSRTKKHEYSRFRCIGDDNSADSIAMDDRTCVFMNICYHTPTKTWNYYSRNKRIIIFDKVRGPIRDFSQDDHGYAIITYFNLFHWAPKIVTKKLPQDRITLSDLHVLFRHWIPDHGPVNLGHFLWEDLMGQYTSLRRAGLDTSNPVIMDMNGNNSDPVFKKFSVFFKGLSSKPPVAFGQYLSQFKTPNVCFEQLQIGGTVGTFQRDDRKNNQGKELFFREFRDRVMTSIHVDPMFVPTSHLIVITKKSGGMFQRGIANVDELQIFLQKMYPSIPVRVVDWSKMSIAKQLEIAVKTTILISPPGGVSMIAPFLPEGAHAIFMDFFATKKQFGYEEGESASMEAAFWGHWLHFKKQYYQTFDLMDHVMDHPNAEDTRWYASVKVDMKRMKDLVDAAIEDMEA
jgi:hypothetical protein